MRTKRIIYIITIFSFLFVIDLADTASASNSSKKYAGPMEIVKTAKLAEGSVYPIQKRPSAKKSQIDLSDLSAQDPLKQPLVIYDGPEGRLFKSKIKADFLETFRPEIDIFQIFDDERKDLPDRVFYVTSCSLKRREIVCADECV